jgi:hypothetical protein
MFIPTRVIDYTSSDMVIQVTIFVITHLIFDDKIESKAVPQHTYGVTRVEDL